jgi:predicted Zn-dependent protease
MLFGGVTRDGLWLIENGVITKAVRNFRWTESPLFALNNVEQIGVEEQSFHPHTSRNPFGGRSFAHSLNNVVVPPLKINDFSFTSTIDAI